MLRLSWVSCVISSLLLGACSTSTTTEARPDGAAPGPTLVCRGVAKPCYELDSGAECLEQVGCEASLGCITEAPGCTSLGRETCAIQPSCRWDASLSRCTIDAARCTPIPERTTCEASDGCRWDLGCRGTVTACEDLSESECAMQEGCILEAP